jgi:hypothetical protein
MPGVVQDKEGRIHMLNEAGSPVSVDASEYGQAVQAGWRPQTVEEYNANQTRKEQSGLGQTALAAGEGALETATLGLGTKAAVELGGEEYRQKAQERAQYHSTARTVGQVAGAVVPGLLSGGEGTVGAIARATPAGALARASGALEGAVAAGLERAGIGEAGGLLGAMANRGAALGAQGAFEGAAYGVGSTLAQSALENTDWTAERALAGLEDGALYGLAGGAALGAGGALVSRAGKAAADAMLGEGTTFKQTVQNWADKRTVKGLIGDDARAFNKLTRNGEDMERIGDLAQKIRSRGVAEAKDIPAAIEREISDSNAIAGTIEQNAEAAGVRPNTGGMVQDLRAQVNELRSMDTPHHDQVANLLERRLDRFERANTTRVAHPDGTVTSELRQPTFEELRSFKSATGRTIDFAKRDAPLAVEEARKFYGTIARTLEDTADAMGPEAGTAYKAAMRDMDDFITVKGAMKRQAVQAARAKFMQGADVQAGMGGALAALVLGHGGPMAALAGAATSAASKYIRERGAQGVGKLADWALRSEQGMRDAADKMAGLGSPGSHLTRAAIQFRESPKEEEKHFEAIRGALMAYQQDPASLGPKIEKAIGPIAHEQPEVAVAMGREITKDYAYLSSLAPKPMSRAANSLTPAKETIAYAKRDKAKLVNAAKALAAPRSVWAGIADGHTNWDGLEALKERRPQQFADMRNHVIRAVNEAKSPLPPRRRVLLGLAFDFNADWGMNHVQEIQAVGQAKPDQGQTHPAMSGVQTDSIGLPSQGVQQGAAQ